MQPSPNQIMPSAILPSYLSSYKFFYWMADKKPRQCCSDGKILTVMQPAEVLLWCVRCVALLYVRVAYATPTKSAYPPTVIAREYLPRQIRPKQSRDKDKCTLISRDCFVVPPRNDGTRGLLNTISLLEIVPHAQQLNVFSGEGCTAFWEWKYMVEVKIISCTAGNTTAFVTLPNFQFHRWWNHSVVFQIGNFYIVYLSLFHALVGDV